MQSKRLPYEEIRSMGIDQILEELNDLSPQISEHSEEFYGLFYQIMGTKEYCKKLGMINLRQFANPNEQQIARVHYAAALVVIKGYSF